METLRFKDSESRGEGGTRDFFLGGILGGGCRIYIGRDFRNEMKTMQYTIAIISLRKLCYAIT